MKKLIVIIILLIWISEMHAQYPSLNFESVSVQQGLEDYITHCILQDRLGFLWVGGPHGLYKYNGYNFIHYQYFPGQKDSILYNTVSDIQEDKFGLLWIISASGISVLDPEKENSKMIYPFLTDPKNFVMINDMALLKDSYENIWASGNTGLIKISYKSNEKSQISNEVFRTGKIDKIIQIDTFSLQIDEAGTMNLAISIYEDKRGNIWASNKHGMYILTKGSKQFRKLNFLEPFTNNLISNSSYRFLQIGENDYLIGSIGLFQLKNLTQEILINASGKLSGQVSIKQINKDEAVFALFEDSRKTIWMSTHKNFYKMRRENPNGEITLFSLRSTYGTPDESAFNGIIRKVTEDKTGLIWITQNYNGIAKFNPDQSQFLNYKNLLNRYFKSGDINPVWKDNQDNLWIGEFESGVYCINSRSHRMIPISTGVVCMAEKGPGEYWIGTMFGVWVIQTSSGKIYNPLPDNEASKLLKNSMVNAILRDGNRFYIASSSGLYLFDINSHKLYQYQFIKRSYGYDQYNWFCSLVKMKNGEIWTGASFKGINKVNFNPDSGKLTLTTEISDRTLKEHAIDINCRHLIYEDQKGIIWINNASGLNRIDLTTQQFKSFFIEGVKYPEAWSMVEDNKGNIWLGTHLGLACFNKTTEKFQLFDKSMGVPILYHGYNSVFKDKDGILYFGGIGGLYSFNPDNLKTNSLIPPVVITSFKINNKTILPDTQTNSILAKNITYTTNIELPYYQNDISFEFAVLDYNEPLKNKYAYILENYQKTWVSTDAKNRNAVYTNLSPGKYIFKVKGSNNDGVWNEKATTISIVIHPPWWATTFSRIMFAILFILATWGFIRWRIQKIKREKASLEKIVKTRTAQLEEQKEEINSQKDMLEKQNHQIRELDQLKNRFFTNISHEFRTPLSLIQSPVEELLEDPRKSDKERRKLSMIQRNSKRLLNLVNQLLDISKIDGSKMKLELSQGDVINHLKTLTDTFVSLAETKSIAYQRYFSNEITEDWFDADKLEKITVNLLSNAFKFTPEGGEIRVTVNILHPEDTSYPDSILEISVRDNGEGIPAGSLGKIFDRFYQVEESLKREGGGTGIGLSLTKDMVGLCHGEIRVESKHGKGSTFTVTMPLGKDHLNEHEFIILKSNEQRIDISYLPEERSADSGDDESFQLSNDKRPFILVVEDNEDIRSQLYDNLSDTYCIMEAIDGVAGLKKATEFMPDLILTDIMMPRMDGLELCKQLKADERTSHIPIVMLTAKVTVEDKITGLLTGADDYMPKPFNMQELKARIGNLIESRKKLRERFSREVTLEPKDVTITSVDEKFLNRAIEVVEKHIGEENFDIPEFRKEMNMSRSTLFRKLYALTNQSPNEFIRTVRLKRASTLLKQGFGNISEVALEVGFSNPSYFSKCFKSMYQVSPMEFIKEHQT